MSIANRYASQSAESVPEERPLRGLRRRRRRRIDAWAWAFLLPTVVLFGGYTIYPVIASVSYSLLDLSGINTTHAFAGLQNYADVTADPLFWNAFRNTILFTVVTVPTRVFLALAAALLLNNPLMPLRNLFRTALFLPVVTTTAIIGVVMQFVFDPSSGPINLILERLHIISQGIDFLGSPNTSIWTVMGVHVWKWFGVTLVYWLAALQTVPGDVQEAAHVDGASNAQAFRFITLPLLRPFLVIITLLTIVDTLQVFDLMLTMTDGGPLHASEVIEIYIYRWAFAATIPKLGFASAAAVLFGLLCLVMTAIQLIGVRATQSARKETS